MVGKFTVSFGIRYYDWGTMLRARLSQGMYLIGFQKFKTIPSHDPSSRLVCFFQKKVNLSKEIKKLKEARRPRERPTPTSFTCDECGKVSQCPTITGTKSCLALISLTLLPSKLMSFLHFWYIRLPTRRFTFCGTSAEILIRTVLIRTDNATHFSFCRSSVAVPVRTERKMPCG